MIHSIYSTLLTDSRWHTIIPIILPTELPLSSLLMLLIFFLIIAICTIRVWVIYLTHVLFHHFIWVSFLRLLLFEFFTPSSMSITACLQFFFLVKLLFGAPECTLELEFAWNVLYSSFLLKRGLTELILILLDLLKNLFYPLSSDVVIIQLFLLANRLW